MMAGLPVGVTGAGYVGLTTAACLAHLGHRVICADIDTTKIADLCQGRVPFVEPALPELVEEGLSRDQLYFTTDKRHLRQVEIAFVCVPTPMGPDGAADMGAFHSAVRELATQLQPGCIVVTKSTVPVGTTSTMKDLLQRPDLPVVSNPEFLREAHAVEDFLYPDRIVIGSEDESAALQVAALYGRLRAPIIHTDPASAEMAKYANNAFLAAKLSYINILARLCERLGADIAEVTKVMSLDERIGSSFLAPGPGWGGSCLPKDVDALIHCAEQVGIDFDLLRATTLANQQQQTYVVDKVRRAVTGSSEGSLHDVRLGVLGLTFKAGTNDMRFSPALEIAYKLADQGSTVVAYDPGMREESSDPSVGPIHVVDDPYQVADEAAGIVLLTEWPEFRELDWDRLAATADQPVMVDARNLLDPKTLTASGFAYFGVGIADFR